MVTAK